MSDKDKEFLDILRFNYEKLNNAVWEAHKIAWTMTGIFVPVISGGLGLFLKEYSNRLETEKTAVFFISVLLMTIIWFWYFMLRILDRYNSVRFEQLRRLERTFNAFYKDIPSGTEIKQYLLRYRGRFQKNTFILALVLTTVPIYALINAFICNDYRLEVRIVVGLILSVVLLLGIDGFTEEKSDYMVKKTSAEQFSQLADNLLRNRFRSLYEMPKASLEIETPFELKKGKWYFCRRTLSFTVEHLWPNVTGFASREKISGPQVLGYKLVRIFKPISKFHELDAIKEKVPELFKNN